MDRSQVDNRTSLPPNPITPGAHTLGTSSLLLAQGNSFLCIIRTTQEGLYSSRERRKAGMVAGLARTMATAS